jgi:polysaccharide export outer membrane protein
MSTDAPASSKVRPLFIRRSTDEPVLAQAPTGESCRSAMMLRPVPVGTDASAWTTAQRVTDQTPAGSETGISQAVTMERPQSAPPIVQTTNAEGMPAGPLPIAVTDGPKLDGSPQVSVAPPTQQVLPPPRIVGGAPGAGAVAGVSGYPELPPTLVTHPVEAPREFSKRAVSAYIIEPPDVLLIEGYPNLFDKNLPIGGPHLVRPDGTIGLGVYGSVFVAGMTIDQAKEQVIALLQQKIPKEKKIPIDELRGAIKVDVAAYNSKFYYVITDGGGYGEVVVRVPFTGNETVLDAVAQIQGLPAVASKKLIWVARATPDDHANPNVLPVDWCGITQRGSAATNYQLYPGDRIYVNSDKRIRTDSWLAKTLAPIERILGVTLLGSSVVNSIKNGSNSSGNGVTR